MLYIGERERTARGIGKSPEQREKGVNVVSRRDMARAIWERGAQQGAEDRESIEKRSRAELEWRE